MVPVVVYPGAHGLGVDAQIADHHRFEQKSEPGEIAEQVFRSRAERRRRDRWVHEVTLGGDPHPGPGPQMRRPRRLVLHNHEAFEGGEVGTGGVVRHRRLPRTGDVARDRCQGRGGRDVASERAQEAVDAPRVAADAVGPPEVDAANVVDVARVYAQGRVGRGSEVPRPAADAYEPGEIAHRQVGRRMARGHFRGARSPATPRRSRTPARRATWDAGEAGRFAPLRCAA